MTLPAIVSRRMFLLAFAVLLLEALTATPAAATIDSVFVDPETPSEGDTVTAIVYFHYPDVCWTLQDVTCSVDREQNSILVDIYATDSWTPGTSCLLMLQDYIEKCVAGELSAGDYVVVVKEHVQSLRTPGGQQAVSFVVRSSVPVQAVSWGSVKSRYW